MPARNNRAGSALDSDVKCSEISQTGGESDSEDNNCKEPEMQIGYPTDVKHVAHIGWDGPSVNPPSWMGEFRSAPELSTPNMGFESSMRGTQNSQARVLPELPRPTRRQQSSSGDSPTKEATSKPKHSRRQQPAGDAPDAPRHPRRHQNSGLASEAPQIESSGTSKNGRRKKSKGSSGGGSARSRTKAASYSDSDARSVDSNPPPKLEGEEV